MIAIQYLIVFYMTYLLLFKILDFKKLKNPLKINISFFFLLGVFDVYRQLYYGYQPVRGYDFILGIIPVIISLLYMTNGFRKWQTSLSILIAIFISIYISWIATAFFLGLFGIDAELLYTHGFYGALSAYAGLQLLLIVYWIIRMTKIRISVANLSLRDILLILGFIYIFGFFVTSIFTLGSEMENAVFGAIMSFFTLISGLISIYIITYLSSQRTLIADIRNRESQQEFIFKEQEQHYERIRKKDEEILAFKHNIRDEMKFLNTILNNSDVDDNQARTDAINYLNEMNSTFKEIEQMTGFETGSNAVNASWFNFTHDKNYQNISTSWNGIFPPGLLISERDLILLFSNILSNAFEAATNVVNQAYVSVEIKSQNKGLTIIARNNYRHNIVKEVDGKFVSSKVDKKNHGIGTKIIKRIVNKYSGDIEFQYSDCEFIILIMFDSVIVS